MATQVKYTIEFIADLNRYVTENNPNGTVKAIQDNGYVITNSASLKEIQDKLMSIYKDNRGDWAKILREVPHDNNINNWTTSPQTDAAFRSSIDKAMGVDTSTAKIGIDWIDKAIEVGFGGGETVTTGGSSSTIDTTASLTAVSWFSAIAAVVLGALGYFIFFHKQNATNKTKFIVGGIYVVILGILGILVYNTAKKATVTTSTTGATSTGTETSGILGPIIDLFKIG